MAIKKYYTISVTISRTVPISGTSWSTSVSPPSLRKFPRLADRRYGRAVMRWQVKAVRSGRIGIWRRNRHRTMKSISALVGDQNGTSHGPLWEAASAAAVQLTRLGHPRFLDAVGAQTADFNEVRSPKNPTILGLIRLNFLSVRRIDFRAVAARVGPAHVVHKHNDDIGGARLGFLMLRVGGGWILRGCGRSCRRMCRLPWRLSL